VTGGGTIEKIDDVRYVSNFSSGKMASSLATALYCKGADVNLIATRFDSDIPKNMHTIDVESSQEMHEYLVDSLRIAKKGKLSKATLVRDEHIHLIQKKPYLFMAAAVSDYVPTFMQDGKLKKEMLGENFELSLKQNIDILSSLNTDGVCTVGFKAEMDKDNARDNAREMLKRKNLDAVCLNILEDSTSFGTDTNKIDFITQEKLTTIDTADKLAVSFSIIKNAQTLSDADE